MYRDDRAIKNIYNYYECRLDYPLNYSKAIKGSIEECKDYCDKNEYCMSFDYCKFGKPQDHWCHVKNVDSHKFFKPEKN